MEKVQNKIVYNAKYGGFSLSVAAEERLIQLGINKESIYLLPRHDARLISVVEELGDDANGAYARLRIGYIFGNKYRIDEYDGFETIQEPNDIDDWVTID